MEGPGSVPHLGKAVGDDTDKQSAAHAYDTVAITSEIGDDPEAESTRFAIAHGNDYDNTNRDVVDTQLVKAGFRLAKLLEAIFN